MLYPPTSTHALYASVVKIKIVCEEKNRATVKNICTPVHNGNAMSVPSAALNVPKTISMQVSINNGGNNGMAMMLMTTPHSDTTPKWKSVRGNVKIVAASDIANSAHTFRFLSALYIFSRFVLPSRAVRSKNIFCNVSSKN